ncbi:hypothetical cytosolic protein [Syntrophus aciditrophicus SB]|uniref:Hypothetical cytosolic protein n=1 Tax=Syntrophus aciditrophicus (strain SB) TaxID=56780 RepID=Q2LSZ8_SYNAS|nr:hypothetical cytosolic protein [Syntrophus aciditrophicus SB]
MKGEEISRWMRENRDNPELISRMVSPQRLTGILSAVKCEYLLNKIKFIHGMFSAISHSDKNS